MPTPPPPAPRPVPLGAMDWNASFLLLFGGIWAVVGLVLCTAFTVIGGPVWNDWILDRRGVRAEATALEVRPTSTRVNRRLVYEIRFRFDDGDGKAWTARTSTTSTALVGAAQAGKSFEIQYDPESPDRTRAVGESASVMGMAVLVPLGAGFVGLGLVAVGLLSALRTRRIYREGEAVQARVTEVVATSSRQNRRPVMRMSYVFQTPAGPVEGRWKTAHPSAQGATLWVLFDPADPSRNVPVVNAGGESSR